MTAQPPRGWSRARNFTPWASVTVLSGTRPLPDEIAVSQPDDDSDGITRTYNGLIYVVGHDDETAFKLAADITRGLTAVAFGGHDGG